MMIQMRHTYICGAKNQYKSLRRTIAEILEHLKEVYQTIKRIKLRNPGQQMKSVQIGVFDVIMHFGKSRSLQKGICANECCWPCCQIYKQLVLFDG